MPGKQRAATAISGPKIASLGLLLIAASGVLLPSAHAPAYAQKQAGTNSALADPAISAVVNAASFRPMSQPNSALGPGTIVALFGTDLATGTELASTIPLPTSLLGTTVTFNGIAAPLFFVSNAQINALVPFELVIGTAKVQVKRDNASSPELPVVVATVSPGLFTLNQQGTGPGVILHASDYRLVSESAPASSGEIVILFCTGLGPVVEPERPGQRDTLSRPLVDVADTPAEVPYSGLAPNYVGLYQVNIRVPSGVPTGRHPLQLTINRVPSNTVSIAVRQH